MKSYDLKLGQRDVTTFVDLSDADAERLGFTKARKTAAKAVKPDNKAVTPENKAENGTGGDSSDEQAAGDQEAATASETPKRGRGRPGHKPRSGGAA